MAFVASKLTRPGQGSLTREIWRRELRAMTANRALSFLWLIFEPIAILFLIWFVFKRTLFNVNGPSYFIYMGTGYIAWQCFIRILISGCNVFIKYKTILNQSTASPISIFLGVVLAEATVSIILFSIYFILALFMGWRPGYSLFLFPFAFVTLLSVAALFALAAGSINVFVRDVGNVVGMISRFGMWILPIFWKPEHVTGIFHTISVGNPVFFLLEFCRWTIDTSTVTAGTMDSIPYYVSAICVIGAISTWIYRRLKPSMAEYL
ncbi:ABC transporter permease [Mesorhizobium zhangyense]|uniref:ABC transporter permease n=1 Tax=Mesorhizobium zhangyense TaxID=1776730 RepID=UPI002483B074|nr:ABC transporter permease [Mesorhizobium zhangyense]